MEWHRSHGLDDPQKVKKEVIASPRPGPGIVKVESAPRSDDSGAKSKQERYRERNREKLAEKARARRAGVQGGGLAEGKK